MVAAKRLNQRARDRKRKIYKLALPRDLDEERVAAWVRSISGTLQPSALHVGGSPTIVFEVWASSEGITHLLKVPYQHADYVIAQLRSLVAGIRVTPADGFRKRSGRGQPR